MDDILGQQQDELARQRYELAKVIESAPEFAGCKTAFDVFRRVLDLHGEDALRPLLNSSLTRSDPTFDAKPWIDQLLHAVRENDQEQYSLIQQRALIAGMLY
jgi:hypothetical protein